MKTLVVYYSKAGHTKWVAERIARTAEAELEEIVEAGKRHGNVRSAFDAVFKREPELKPMTRSLEDYEFLFIGTPVWRMNAVPAMQAFLPTVDWAGKRVALFCTMGGMGDKRTFATMRDLLGPARVAGELGLSGRDLKDKSSADARITDWVKRMMDADVAADG